jgi:hypothetical protein
MRQLAGEPVRQLASGWMGSFFLHSTLGHYHSCKMAKIGGVPLLAHC